MLRSCGVDSGQTVTCAVRLPPDNNSFNSFVEEYLANSVAHQHCQERTVQLSKCTGGGLSHGQTFKHSDWIWQSSALTIPRLLSGTLIHRLNLRPLTFMPSEKLHFLQLFVLWLKVHPNSNFT